MLAELDPTKAAAPGPLIRWLWFDLMPEQIRAHLLQQAMLEGDNQIFLLELAALADLQHTKDSRHIDSVAALSSRPASNGLRRTGQDRGNNKEPEYPDWCFFHNCFGSKAKKCKLGCKWKAEN